MTTFCVATFGTPQAAEPALRALERLQTRRVVAVDDAAVVVWPAGERRPRAYQAGTVAGTAALVDAFWGLLFGSLFLLPLAGSALGGAGLSLVGLSDEFLRRVRDLVTPGTSAVFLLTPDAVVDRIRESLAGDHAEVLLSTLAREQEEALRRAFETDDAR